MAWKIVFVGCVLLAFGLGYFIALPDEQITQVLNEKLATEMNKNKLLKESNDELAETLGLVRRQVQTDRIAYEGLKDDVQRAQEQRVAMQEKFESQRVLLERLKKKIDGL